MGARRVIVLGKGTLAIRIAEWFRASDEYELRCLVPVVPEPTWTASLIDWAERAGVPCVRTGDWHDPPMPRAGKAAELGISVFYDRIMPPEFIDRFDRLLNLHNGPLPRYRGVSPINWALKNGERSHGVTIHEISSGIDDGPIVAQLTYSIYPEFDEVIDVYRRALEYAWPLFQQTLPIVDRIEATPQDEAEATYYSLEDNERLGDRRSFTREMSADP
jgi:methionyl-tRNA formyltransferase